MIDLDSYTYRAPKPRDIVKWVREFQNSRWLVEVSEEKRDRRGESWVDTAYMAIGPEDVEWSGRPIYR
jgi:hypothetical protein